MYKMLLLGFIISLMQRTDDVKAIFFTKNAELTLFSEAPMENIEAVSKSAYGVINVNTGEIQFGVSIRSFKFRKALMQEHFNENYMESDKFPAARFKGKLNSPIDITKEGEFQVTATGDLEVHGITKKRSISGTVKVLNGRIDLNSIFDVKCQDHNIKIPSLVFKNIAETLKITLKGTFYTVN